MSNQNVARTRDYRLEEIKFQFKAPADILLSVMMGLFVGSITSITMKKLDLSKKYKHYFTADQQPGIAEFPELVQYVSIKGIGDPSQAEFAEKVQALYATSYAIKFICKARENDFVVPKLEGLWWFDESKYREVTIADAPKKVSREDWQYILLIRMPDFVNHSDITAAKEMMVGKKKIGLAESVEPYKMKEGKVVQILLLVHLTKSQNLC